MGIIGAESGKPKRGNNKSEKENAQGGLTHIEVGHGGQTNASLGARMRGYWSCALL
jgi:hypothetical protein